MANLTEAVLLFYTAGEWDLGVRLRWQEITGHREATTKAIGDMAREVLAKLGR